MRAGADLRLVGGAACLLLLAATAACRSTRDGERPPFREVSPAVAYEIIRDSPDVLILDLRTPAEFLGDTGHVYRAQNIPLERLPFLLKELSPYRDETFLVYCDDGDCAEEGMAVLLSSGFSDAVLIDGGIDAWIRDGFRTVLPAEIAGRHRGDGDEDTHVPIPVEQEPPSGQPAQAEDSGGLLDPEPPEGEVPQSPETAEPPPP